MLFQFFRHINMFKMLDTYSGGPAKTQFKAVCFVVWVSFRVQDVLLYGMDEVDIFNSKQANFCTFHLLGVTTSLNVTWAAASAARGGTKH